MMRVRQNGPNNFFIVQVPPRSTGIVRQMMVLRFFIIMSLVVFEPVWRIMINLYSNFRARSSALR
jgi:hypothetical protein